MKLCKECGRVDGHHPHCPEYDDRDFVDDEPDCFDEYREQRERDQDVCQRRD